MQVTMDGWFTGVVVLPYLGHGFDLERDAVGQNHDLLAAPEPADEEGAVEHAVLGPGRDDVRERGGEERRHRVEGAGADLDLLVDALRRRRRGRGWRNREHVGRALDLDPPALCRHALLDPLQDGGRLC